MVKCKCQTMSSDEFKPKDAVDENTLYRLKESRVVKVSGNTNLAFNVNDKTAARKSL